MKTLHENLHSDLWYVYEMLAECMDDIEQHTKLTEGELNRVKLRISKINEAVSKFVTAEAMAKVKIENAAYGTIAEIRAVCQCIKTAALDYVMNLEDAKILENPKNEVEGSIYFSIGHAIFNSAYQIGRIHEIIGKQE